VGPRQGREGGQFKPATLLRISGLFAYRMESGISLMILPFLPSNSVLPVARKGPHLMDCRVETDLGNERGMPLRNSYLICLYLLTGKSAISRNY